MNTTKTSYAIATRNIEWPHYVQVQQLLYGMHPGFVVQNNDIRTRCYILYTLKLHNRRVISSLNIRPILTVRMCACIRWRWGLSIYAYSPCRLLLQSNHSPCFLVFEKKLRSEQWKLTYLVIRFWIGGGHSYKISQGQPADVICKYFINGSEIEPA